MSDTYITSAPAEVVESAGTTVTQDPGTQTTGVGDVDPNTGNTGESKAGSPQGSTDDGQQDQSSRRWSKVDEIKELRSQRREMRQQMETLRSEIDEMRAAREQMSRPEKQSVERTPANFWQDPEAVFESKLQTLRDELRESIVGEFHNVRQFDQAQASLNQERREAVEFIHSQKGYSPEDEEELIEIIQEKRLGGLQPMDAAEIAWSLLQQRRGIGDRSALKRQASGVVGQPPGAGVSGKIWSQAEYDRTLNELERNPMKLTKELETELLAAHREGRVK